jgi:hypothetical protein
MFIQYGKDYGDAVDEYVYAHFPYANDEFTKGEAQSFWDNNDDVLLGRVAKTEILRRDSWEFWRGPADAGGAGGAGSSETLFAFPSRCPLLLQFSLLLFSHA